MLLWLIKVWVTPPDNPLPLSREGEGVDSTCSPGGAARSLGGGQQGMGMRDPTFHMHTHLPGALWFIHVLSPSSMGLQEDGCP